MCGNASLESVMSLTPTPPGNDLLTKQELAQKEKSYPLELMFCNSCTHIQLGHVVNPEILYQKNYTYVSGTSEVFIEHLRKYSSEIIKRFDLKPKSLVIDIGSNDGTCLSFFKKNNMRVLGIDPAKEIANQATQNGIETINDFFNSELSKKILQKHGFAKLITSHNACAHIDNLIDVVRGVEILLDDDGIFVLEVGYFVDVFQNTWFDTIYHEHLDFHTVAPFKKLFERVDMSVISVERITPQGGSIRVIAKKNKVDIKIDESVSNLIQLERDLGLNEIDTFLEFNNKIEMVKFELTNLVESLKKNGKTIAGFGAPTKATTLMGHFDLDNEILDFIVDDNPLKRGLFTPLSHIPIFSPEALYEKKPDYVLILAWNFAKPIIKNHEKYSKEIGKFIIPMPIPQII